MSQSDGIGEVIGFSFRELPGSPTYRLSRGGASAQRKLRMEWDDAMEFTAVFFNSVNGPVDELRQFEIKAPGQKSLWLTAVGVSVSPSWDGRQDSLTLDKVGIELKDQVAAYEFAEVTLDYETPKIKDVEIDMGIQLTGRKGSNFVFEGTEKSPDGQVQIAEPVQDIRYRYDAQNLGGNPATALLNFDNIRKNIGKVNSDIVFFNRSTSSSNISTSELASLNYDELPELEGYMAGELLLTGADLSFQTKYGKLNPVYDVRFKYKRQGWQKKYNPETKQYETLDPLPFEEEAFALFVPDLSKGTPSY